MIKSEKVTLRDLEPTDFKKFHRWINNPDTNKMRGVYNPMSLQAAKEEIESYFVTSKSILSLIILDKENTPIGILGLRGICNRSRRAEIWIYIGDKLSWGKGLGEAATRSLVNYAFKQLNLHRIWLECDQQNIGAIRCYEKVGFSKEGVLRDGYFRDGEYKNTVMMSILSTDFVFDKTIE